MASELATNCVQHARTLFEISVSTGERDPRRGLATAAAAAPGGCPRRRPEPSGRGLLIVESIADRWGVDRPAGNGKTVWFTLPASRPEKARDTKSGPRDRAPR